MSPLPDFLIIGAERSGTTWLYERLREHPGVYMPADKEVHFFNEYRSDGTRNRNYEFGLEWYSQLFAPAGPQQVRGEATPMYLHCPGTAARIAEAAPSVKILVALRNPVDRALSHWRMLLAKKQTSLPFRQAFDADVHGLASRGLYASQLRDYLRHFDQEKFLLLRLQDVEATPVACLRRAEESLGLTQHDWDSNAARIKVNEAWTYRSPALLDVMRAIGRLLRAGGPLGRWLLGTSRRSGVTYRVRQFNKRPISQAGTALSTADRKELREWYARDQAELESSWGIQLDS